MFVSKRALQESFNLPLLEQDEETEGHYSAPYQHSTRSRSRACTPSWPRHSRPECAFLPPVPHYSHAYPLSSSPPGLHSSPASALFSPASCSPLSSCVSDNPSSYSSSPSSPLRSPFAYATDPAARSCVRTSEGAALHTRGLCQGGGREVSPQLAEASKSSLHFSGPQKPKKAEGESFSPVGRTVPAASESLRSSSTPSSSHVRVQPSSCPGSPRCCLPSTPSRQSLTSTSSGHMRHGVDSGVCSSGARRVRKGSPEAEEYNSSGQNSLFSGLEPSAWLHPPNASPSAAEAVEIGEHDCVPESRNNNFRTPGFEAGSERGDSPSGLQSLSRRPQTKRTSELTHRSLHARANSLSPLPVTQRGGCDLPSEDNVITRPGKNEEVIDSTGATPPPGCSLRHRTASGLPRGVAGGTPGGPLTACGASTTALGGGGPANSEATGGRKGKLRRKKRNPPKVAWRSTMFLRQLEDERNEEKAEEERLYYPIHSLCHAEGYDLRALYDALISRHCYAQFPDDQGTVLYLELPNYDLQLAEFKARSQDCFETFLHLLAPAVPPRSASAFRSPVAFHSAGEPHAAAGTPATGSRHYSSGMGDVDSPSADHRELPRQYSAPCFPPPCARGSARIAMHTSHTKDDGKEKCRAMRKENFLLESSAVCGHLEKSNDDEEASTAYGMSKTPQKKGSVSLQTPESSSHFDDSQLFYGRDSSDKELSLLSQSRELITDDCSSTSSHEENQDIKGVTMTEGGIRRRERPVSFGSLEDRNSSLFDEDKSTARSSSRKHTPDNVRLDRSMSGVLSSGRSSGCERDASGVLSLSSDAESQPARGKQLAWSRKRRARMGGGAGGSLAPNTSARADTALLSEKEDSKGPAADSGSAFASRFSEEICCMVPETRRLSHSEEGERTGCCFVFASGAVVIWGGDAVGGTEMKRELLSNLMWFFGRFATDLVRADANQEDVMFYCYIDEFRNRCPSSSIPRSRVKQNRVYLKTRSLSEKLAVSFAVAQSIRLGVYEALVNSTIARMREIPERMSRFGCDCLADGDTSFCGLVRTSRGTTAAGEAPDDFYGKQFASLLAKMIDVNIIQDFLDVPEYFWEDDKWQSFWQRVHNHLELRERVELLNNRYSCILELLNVVRRERSHSQEFRLTWIIVLLLTAQTIAVALKFFVFNPPGNT
ncbi:family cog1723 domain-containing protein [Cystoisospora suis]|uniref:Family cog1723 domain-containing protein n=1 Tax=Cystoisospora suis TaxID=483139 RepID=A0A2C6KXE2_9APIC|nr:family cog1723 domain-containing protein [Cystoisospora suis]